MANAPKRTRLTQTHPIFGSAAELPVNQLTTGKYMCKYIFKCKQDQEDHGLIPNGRFASIPYIIYI